MRAKYNCRSETEWNKLGYDVIGKDHCVMITKQGCGEYRAYHPFHVMPKKRLITKLCRIVCMPVLETYDLADIAMLIDKLTDQSCVQEAEKLQYALLATSEQLEQDITRYQEDVASKDRQRQRKEIRGRIRDLLSDVRLCNANYRNQLKQSLEENIDKLDALDSELLQPNLSNTKRKKYTWQRNEVLGIIEKQERWINEKYTDARGSKMMEEVEILRRQLRLL